MKIFNNNIINLKDHLQHEGYARKDIFDRMVDIMRNIELMIIVNIVKIKMHKIFS